MISYEDVYRIGRISRTRGITGEVEMVFTDDVFDRGEADFLVLELDGILVPFFWAEYRFKNTETAIVKFDDTDSEAAARRLVGAAVFYPLSFIPETTDDTLPSLQALTGFRLLTPDGRQLGIIERVDTSSLNTLLTLENGLLLPYHDDFLTSFDLRQRTLTLNLPNGILDINS